MKTSKPRAVLTRQNNGELAHILRENGIGVLEMPLINVSTGGADTYINEVMEDMGSYQWITFSSANGVKGFFEAFFKDFDDIRAIGMARIACVGAATANELKKYHLHADIVPEVSTAAAMFEAIAKFESLDNLKILCVQGNLSSQDEVRKLEQEHGAIVDTVEVYKTSQIELKESDPAAKDFRKNGADVVVFASPSAVDSFAKNAAKLTLAEGAAHPKIVSIGSTTSAALEKFGMKAAKEAKTPSAIHIAEAMGELLGIEITDKGDGDCSCGGDCSCHHHHH